MSTFVDTGYHCPACNHAQPFLVIESANAGRHPRFAQQLRDHQFMRFDCESCKSHFFVERQLLYMDLPRQQFLVVFPQASRHDWKNLADVARQSWQTATMDAAARVHKIGHDTEPRLVFGYAELREKVLIRDAGLDDRTVEAIKIRLRLEHPEWKQLSGLVLEQITETGDLLFAHLSPDPNATPMITQVLRSAYEAMHAQQPVWRSMLRDLFSDPWVSARRYA